jgi:multiple sugar transport system ATP-binding protein
MNAPLRTISTDRGGLTLRGITKTYQMPALENVTLDVAPGEVLALTGPSGAGKTTLCRILAGLESADAGTISLAGRNLASVPAGLRRVALMFESYALYPHFTVLENVLSPLRARNAPTRQGRHADGSTPRADVDHVLELLEIAHLSGRLPGALSGGQKQRVALARTLVQTPSLFLLDEPISHLDAKLRHKLRGEIRRRLSKQSAPTIWATPDGMEALSVGDRIAVIDAGRLEQVGSPKEIWSRPASVRVARLLGDPPMNLLPGTLESRGDTIVFLRDGMELALSGTLARAARAAANAEVTLGVRPECLRLGASDAPGACAAELYSSEPFGKHAILTIDFGGLLVKLKTSMAEAAGVGDGVGQPVRLIFPTESLTLFDGVTGRVLPG